MKFILALSPLAFVSVLASGSGPEGSLAYARPSKPSGTLKFSEEGMHNILKASAKNSKADPETVKRNIKEFFNRNPDIIKSIMKVVNDPKYKAEKEDVMAKGLELYNDSKGKAFQENGVKVINYIYDHPKFLQMIQEIGIKLLDEYPGSVDEYFSVFDKLVKRNPSIIDKIKKEIIQFSKDNEEAYYKAFEMVVKSFTIRPRVAARVAVHALESDQISCPGIGPTECACNKESKPEVEAPFANGQLKDIEPSNTEEPESASEEPTFAEETESDPENLEAYELENGSPKPSKAPELAYARPQ